jgi:hypothetical protein
MSDKLTIAFLYLVAVIPATLVFLHMALPWLGKNIKHLPIRLAFIYLGIFLCFYPLILLNGTFQIMYIILHAGTVMVLTSTFVPTLIKKVYLNDTRINSFIVKEGLQFKIQRYSILFYNKKEILMPEFILTTVMMLPFISVFWNNLPIHIVIYCVFLSFLPLYGLLLFWSKLKTTQ